MFFSGALGYSQIIHFVKNTSGRLLLPRKHLQCISFEFSTFYENYLLKRTVKPFQIKNFKVGMATAQTSDKNKHTNRLSREKSPYLLQHASNPVDWYPWGEEAFKKARDEDKLIFLSVGYSTCHWCHVMERESFEDPSVAKLMNEYFINIKVDREERPDVDRIYMQFIQASSKQGGWPMSVFLTPDLKPVSGGTYFPPKDTHFQFSFTKVLLTVAHQWAENRSKMSHAANKVTQLLEQTSAFDVKIAGLLINGDIPGPEVWHKCQDQLYKKFEPLYGGFSKAPKFPRPSFIKLLLHRYVRTPDDLHGMRSKGMSIHTLDCMALGGIHDHLGQGFSRYSVDDKWHVPHFEKMLYDQAQLAVVYANAFQIFKDENYKFIVQGILKYVSSDLSHPEGGFYSAEDADSKVSPTDVQKKEGAFYTWTYDMICKLLNKPLEDRPRYTQGDLFCFHYGVKPFGNIKNDPTGEHVEENVLLIKRKPHETCDKFGIKYDELRNIIAECKEILLEERRKRPRPHLDDKIITSWNGLMISGFARASFVLNDKSYKEKAIAAAKFIKKYLFDSHNKKLLRSCYCEHGNVVQLSKPIEGFQTDYAYMIQALLDLYECTFDQKWLIWAYELQEVQDSLFWDTGHAGYFSTAPSQHNLFRYKDDQDGAEPCGNSVAVTNLIRLGTMLDNDEMKNKATQIFSIFSNRLTEMPFALPEMVSALLMYHDSPTQVVVTGKTDNAETMELISVLRSGFVPGLILMTTGGQDSFLSHKNSSIQKMKIQGGKQAAYVCHGKTCTLPITSPADLAKHLNIQ